MPVGNLLSGQKMGFSVRRTGAVTISSKYARRINGLERQFWGSSIAHLRADADHQAGII
jgi:hypothetical protein